MRILINQCKMVFVGILLLSAVSCKKFLSDYSQNDSFIENTKDLNELLIGGGYWTFEIWYDNDMNHRMDDDIKITAGNRYSKTALNLGHYYWAQDPRVDTEGKRRNSDAFYAKLYERIAVLNTIFESAGLLEAKGQPIAEIDRIRAEAYYLQALYYFILVNYYGKPYNAATASSDYGIPVKTDPAVKETFAVRASVATVYKLIEDNLKMAAALIGNANAGSHVRAHASSIHTLLSRVYLYMGRYEEAVFHADRAIEDRGYQLVDLNNFDNSTNFALVENPEVLFTMSGNSSVGLMSYVNDDNGGVYFLVSEDLVNAYDAADLRIGAFFRNASGAWKIAKTKKLVNDINDASDLFIIRLSEAYLNKAEALAALEQYAEANAVIYEFRKKRFRPEDMSLTNFQGAQLMNFVRDERRRELCFEGHRWFDLRRYAVSPKYKFTKTIRHNAVAYDVGRYVVRGYYELPPYDEDPAGYVVPIANDEIEFNQGRLVNEPRIQRPLKF